MRAWKATTRIKYGQPNGEVKTFEVGEVVTGLSKEEMAQLWESSALEETVVESGGQEPETPVSAPDASTGAAEGGSTEGTPAA